MAKSWQSMKDTGRWVDDMISSEAGRSGQEAKRRRAGRLKKGEMDAERFIKQLEMADRASHRSMNRLLGPRRPPRSR